MFFSLGHPKELGLKWAGFLSTEIQTVSTPPFVKKKSVFFQVPPPLKAELSYMWRSTPSPTISTLPRVIHLLFLSHPPHNHTKLQLIIHSPVELSRIPAFSNKSCCSGLIRVAKVTISNQQRFNPARPIRLSVSLPVKFRTLKHLVRVPSALFQSRQQAYILVQSFRPTPLLFSELFNLPSSAHPTPIQPFSKLYKVFEVPFLFSLSFFFFVSFSFWLHLWHMEVPRSGIESKPQLRQTAVVGFFFFF